MQQKLCEHRHKHDKQTEAHRHNIIKETEAQTCIETKKHTRRHEPETDEDGDEEGADGVGNHPAEVVDQCGRDDHSHTAQRVSHDVQEDAYFVVVV